jgi:putative hemolysin
MRYGRNTAHSRPSGPRFSVALALDAADVIEAQRLRYRVFAEEMGARLPHASQRLDRDRFDPYCDHLLVRDAERGSVVGTYRLLPSHEALKLGGFSAEAEFDLGAVRDLPGLIELGRACVDPDYRTGAVIGLLWSGLARYLRAGGHAYAIGCASIPARTDGRTASAVCRRLLADHLGPAEWRVVPRTPFPLADVAPAPRATLPALIRGYLCLGAMVCGEPAWDPEFGTADLLFMLPIDRLDGRWARRLLRS